MAGRGPAPKSPQNRRNKSQTPQRGEWKASPGVGWQHGEIPEPPDVRPASREAWGVWMRSWFASHWTPDDLPGLRLVIQYHDQVQLALDDPFIESEGPKGGTVYVKRPSPQTELRQMMDSYGITLKGQQDRRWVAPAKTESPRQADAVDAAAKPAGLYGHLRSVTKAG